MAVTAMLKVWLISLKPLLLENALKLVGVKKIESPLTVAAPKKPVRALSNVKLTVVPARVTGTAAAVPDTNRAPAHTSAPSDLREVVRAAPD